MCPRLHTHATLIQFNSICTMLRHEPTIPPLRAGATATCNFDPGPSAAARNLDCILICPGVRATHSKRVEGGPWRRQMKHSTKVAPTNALPCMVQWLFCNPPVLPAGNPLSHQSHLVLLSANGLCPRPLCEISLCNNGYGNRKQSKQLAIHLLTAPSPVC